MTVCASIFMYSRASLRRARHAEDDAPWAAGVALPDARVLALFGRLLVRLSGTQLVSAVGVAEVARSGHVDLQSLPRDDLAQDFDGPGDCCFADDRVCTLPVEPQRLVGVSQERRPEAFRRGDFGELALGLHERLPRGLDIVRQRNGGAGILPEPCRIGQDCFGCRGRGVPYAEVDHPLPSAVRLFAPDCEEVAGVGG